MSTAHYRGRVFTRLRPVIAVCAVAVALCGCAASPEPADPSPAFTSEADAFAAAEETYRAYVDALNGRRGEVPDADPQQFLIATALEVDIDTQRQLEQAGLSILGPTKVKRLRLDHVSKNFDQVVTLVCLDSSSTRVVDQAGENVTPTDRAAEVLIEVKFARSGDQFLIEDSSTVDPDTC